MAGRLRLPRAAALIAVLVVGLGSHPARASEGWTCWSGTTEGEGGQLVQVTRCRLGGSRDVVDYGSERAVPVLLEPAVGWDAGGVCWYWTTRDTDWVVLGVDDSLAATLGIDPDGVPGGPVIISATYPVCTTEPGETPQGVIEAYELLARYEHRAPDPEIDPPVGSGITGFDTYLTDVPPDPWSASLVSPVSGLTVEVETRVAAIEVDWGDGTIETIPAEAFGLLTGWPDGAFPHVYDTKTCDPPGGPACHPTLDAYRLVVRYLWTARYRIDGGAWEALAVAPTETEYDYDVDEIRGLTTAVG